MRRIHYLESGDYSVRFSAYCGMTWLIGEDRQTREDAIATAARTIAAREASNHPVSTIGPDRWEIGEPEDAILVPDTAGILAIEPYLLRAIACHECDSIVPIGEGCADCRHNRETPFDDEVSFPTED